MSKIEWYKLVEVSAFIPIRELGLVATDEERERQLMKSGDNQYLLITPFDSLGDSTPKSGGPFFAGFYWVVSDSAMSRVFDSKVEVDEEDLINVEPPHELMIGASSSRYGDVLSACKKRSNDVIESASYRIATDGKFICREISIADISFYFRCNEDIDDDPVFAIEYRKN